MGGSGVFRYNGTRCAGADFCECNYLFNASFCTCPDMVQTSDAYGDNATESENTTVILPPASCLPCACARQLSFKSMENKNDCENNCAGADTSGWREHNARLSLLPPAVIFFCALACCFKWGVSVCIRRTGPHRGATRVTSREVQQQRSLTDRLIKAIPTEAFAAESHAELGLNSGDCAICLSAFVEGNPVKNLACRHTFCAGCLDEWIRSQGRTASLASIRCPLCKAEIVAPGDKMAPAAAEDPPCEGGGDDATAPAADTSGIQGAADAALERPPLEAPPGPAVEGRASAGESASRPVRAVDGAADDGASNARAPPPLESGAAVQDMAPAPATEPVGSAARESATPRLDDSSPGHARSCRLPRSATAPAPASDGNVLLVARVAPAAAAAGEASMVGWEARMVGAESTTPRSPSDIHMHDQDR
mmetsp:Transcript_324/g.918  ORF Transcript_324/g.918 Transcript_324/m.918 type:complete len:423 (+) Transcript_324:141-1409(+)